VRLIFPTFQEKANIFALSSRKDIETFMMNKNESVSNTMAYKNCFKLTDVH